MPTCVALLRGVNVGNNLLKMERLRALSYEIGLKNVRTYLQSGNLLFEADGTASKWAQALEGRLAGETRLPVTVLVRTSSEIAHVRAANPFLKDKGVDPARLHVTFLERAPQKTAVEALAKIKAGPDRFRWLGSEIYLHCPDGYGRSKLSNTAVERVLGVRATTRNWNTVTKLCSMCGE